VDTTQRTIVFRLTFEEISGFSKSYYTLLRTLLRSFGDSATPRIGTARSEIAPYQNSEVLPSANHSTGFRPVRGCCKFAPPMSKTIRRLRDIAAGACPPHNTANYSKTAAKESRATK